MDLVFFLIHVFIFSFLFLTELFLLLLDPFFPLILGLASFIFEFILKWLVILDCP